MPPHHVEVSKVVEIIDSILHVEEYYLDSLAAILQENIGQPVTCEFLIGTNNIVRRDGVLYSAGVNFVTLYQPNEGRYVVCDVYSLKFITFYEPRNGGNPTMRFDSQGRPVSGSNMMQNNAPNAFPNMSPNNRSSF